MALLTKEQILRVKDIETRTVHVPEWGGDVMVRGMTGIERDQFEAKILDQSGKKTKVNLQNARARLVSITVVDEEGNRIFNENEVVLLGTKSATALSRVYDVAASLSGISDEDIEELLGNSEATTIDDSLSA